jgi:hypothetical protein
MMEALSTSETSANMYQITGCSIPEDSNLQARCSELSSGLYCRVKWLSTDVSEVRTASIIRDDSSEHHTRRRENLKSRIFKLISARIWNLTEYRQLLFIVSTYLYNNTDVLPAANKYVIRKCGKDYYKLKLNSQKILKADFVWGMFVTIRSGKSLYKKGLDLCD